MVRTCSTILTCPLSEWRHLTDETAGSLISSTCIGSVASERPSAAAVGYERSLGKRPCTASTNRLTRTAAGGPATARLPCRQKQQCTGGRLVPTQAPPKRRGVQWCSRPASAFQGLSGPVRPGEPVKSAASSNKANMQVTEWGGTCVCTSVCDKNARKREREAPKRQSPLAPCYPIDCGLCIVLFALSMCVCLILFHFFSFFHTHTLSLLRPQQQDWPTSVWTGSAYSARSFYCSYCRDCLYCALSLAISASSRDL